MTSLGSRVASAWLPLSAGAAIASASHIVIDFAAKVYPPDTRGYVLIALPALILYALWVRALGRVRIGSTGATKLAGILALVQAALANGLAGFFPCPPTALWGGVPACSFSPWQDLAHIGSLVFGLGAFIALRHRSSSPADAEHTLLRLGVSVLIVHLVLAGVVASMTV